MFDLTQAKYETSWKDCDFALKSKRFEIQFDTDHLGLFVNPGTIVRNVKVLFGKKKLHRTWNLADESYTINVLQIILNEHASAFIKEYYKDFL